MSKTIDSIQEKEAKNVLFDNIDKLYSTIESVISDFDVVVGPAMENMIDSALKEMENCDVIPEYDLHMYCDGGTFHRYNIRLRIDIWFSENQTSLSGEVILAVSKALKVSLVDIRFSPIKKDESSDSPKGISLYILFDDLASTDAAWKLFDEEDKRKREKPLNTDSHD